MPKLERYSTDFTYYYLEILFSESFLGGVCFDVMFQTVIAVVILISQIGV